MRSTVALCVEAFIDDFNNRWGSGKNVLTYREGKRRQPQGFRSKHLMATSLDPRTKVLYEIEDYEHEGVLTILPRRATFFRIHNLILVPSCDSLRITSILAYLCFTLFYYFDNVCIPRTVFYISTPRYVYWSTMANSSSPTSI